MLEEEYLVLLGDIRLLDLIAMRLLKIVDILHQIINLEGVLLGDIVSQVLQALHLEIIIRPLHEVLEKEILLALNHLLGRNKRHNHIALVRQLGILIKLILDTVVVDLGEFNLL